MVPQITVSDELREFMAAEETDAIVVDIIDCVNCCRHLNEVFAYAPKGARLAKLAGDAVTAFQCGDLRVLVISPDLVVGDAVSFVFNGNRHLGNIDVEGISIRES